MMYSDGGKNRQHPSTTSATAARALRRGPRSAGRQPQPKPRPCRCNERNRQIRQNQPLKAVAIGSSQAEHDRRRDRDADHDAPEEPFLGVEASALAAIGNRQPEEDGARAAQKTMRA